MIASREMQASRSKRSQHELQRVVRRWQPESHGKHPSFAAFLGLGQNSGALGPCAFHSNALQLWVLLFILLAFPGSGLPQHSIPSLEEIQNPSTGFSHPGSGRTLLGSKHLPACRLHLASDYGLFLLETFAVSPKGTSVAKAAPGCNRLPPGF